MVQNKLFSVQEYQLGFSKKVFFLDLVFFSFFVQKSTISWLILDHCGPPGNPGCVDITRRNQGRNFADFCTKLQLRSSESPF